MSHKEQIDRNIDYLHRNKVAYKAFPKDDIPTQVFEWGYFFKEGTANCFDLFRSKAKITTYKSLKWHIITLRYLNLDSTELFFKKIIRFISERDNGFITFTTKDYIVDSMIDDALSHVFDIAPNNKIRKVIFKDSTGLSTKEKCRIVGELIGKSKSVENEDIYECMLYINNINKKITIASLAKMLSCSSRTIHRNMDKELKKEKELLNEHYEKI